MEQQETSEKFRLPREFAEKWIAALESGEYVQGLHKLAQENLGIIRYCCLGVAEVVCGFDPKDLVARRASTPSVLGSDSKVPEELQVRMHEYLETDDSFFKTLVGRLVELNDYKRKNFKEIAQWIRDNVELYD